MVDESGMKLIGMAMHCMECVPCHEAWKEIERHMRKCDTDAETDFVRRLQKKIEQRR